MQFLSAEKNAVHLDRSVPLRSFRLSYGSSLRESEKALVKDALVPGVRPQNVCVAQILGAPTVFQSQLRLAAAPYGSKHDDDALGGIPIRCIESVMQILKNSCATNEVCNSLCTRPKTDLRFSFEARNCHDLSFISELRREQMNQIRSLDLCNRVAKNRNGCVDLVFYIGFP